MSRGYLVLLVVVAVVVGAGVYWLRQPAVPPPIDGIACQPMEATGFHIHAHLEIWLDGRRVEIPAGIGGVSGCWYWLHTHTPDGIVHIEAPRDMGFTWGQFFAIWGKAAPVIPPDAKVWVDREDGKGSLPYAGDWHSLVLTAHQKVSIGTGDFTPQSFTFPEGL